MVARFLRRFRRSSTSKVNFKGKFFRVDRTLGADITVNVIIKFCIFRKMDKMYMLILVTTDL